MTTTCPSCGARVPEDQSKCDLCGTSLSSSERESSSSDRTQRDAFRSEGGHKCPVCGSLNPKGSRFCNQCGSKIEAVRSASDLTDLPTGRRGEEPGAPAPSSDASEGANGDLMVSRVLWTVGAGIVVMMVLYGVTLLSEGQSQSGGSQSSGPAVSAQQSTGADTSAASGAAGPVISPEPVPDGIAGDVKSLEESIAAAADSAERIELQQKLVRLYVNADRQDLAGQLQEKIAAARQTAMAWADAGNLYYDWMMERQSRREQTAYAKKAIQAYRRSLEIDPTNLDVRTDMAVAYLYDPDNPMEAIRQTKKVLSQDPDHLQANFNRGIMLLRINRVDQAIKQFEKVQEMAGPSSPVYQRAEKVLQRIRQQRGQ